MVHFSYKKKKKKSIKHNNPTRVTLKSPNMHSVYLLLMRSSSNVSFDGCLYTKIAYRWIPEMKIINAVTIMLFLSEKYPARVFDERYLLPVDSGGPEPIKSVSVSPRLTSAPGMFPTNQWWNSLACDSVRLGQSGSTDAYLFSNNFVERTKTFQCSDGK